MTLKNRIAKLEVEYNTEVEQHIAIDYETCTVMVNDELKKPYIPPVTCLKFHQSNASRRLLMGPYGSGKSTTCCVEIVVRACQMPPCYDGVRRSRWVIVRNTYGDLDSTSLKTWLEWFGFLGNVHRRMTPRLCYTHTFNDGKGKVELEVMFLALDRPDHIRKLKSLELTGVYLNEMSEIPMAALVHFKARINRFPAVRDCGKPYWSGIIADTNPPETDHWLYKLFEEERPTGHKVFHQPAALIKDSNGEYVANPEAENIEHQAKGYDYYFEMMQGQSEEFIKVFIQGKYGTVVDGKFVYTNYNDDLHSVDTIDIDTDEPILLSWDYGTVSPACLISQLIAGQLLAIKEFVCEYMTVKELCKTAVIPFLTKYCQGIVLEDLIGDPADTYDGRAQLQELGFTVIAARTNKIEARIRAVRDFLNGLVEGHPTFLVSAKGCPKLRQGFLGKYHYRRLRVIGEERYQDVPHKNHPHSDIHDCLQYAALHYADVQFYEEPEKYDFDAYYDKEKSRVTGY